MAKNNIIEVRLFGLEVGKLGYDMDKRMSYFQYNPDFLQSDQYTNIFPYIFKRVKPVQVFHQFEGETFRGLPPMIADSLPDMFEGMEKFQQLSGWKDLNKALVYGGNDRQNRTAGKVVPWKEFGIE